MSLYPPGLVGHVHLTNPTANLNTHRVEFIPLDTKDPTFGPFDVVMPIHVGMMDGAFTLPTASGHLWFSGLPNQFYRMAITPIVL